MHVGALEQPVDGELVALQHGEHAVGKAGLAPQPRQPQRRRRVLLARLEDNRVACGDRDREEPHRHHRGEVERRDDPDHPEGLLDRVHVDPGRDVLAERALDQVRETGRQLDDLLAASDLAHRVGDHLAVLGRDDLRPARPSGRSAARGTRTARPGALAMRVTCSRSRIPASPMRSPTAISASSASATRAVTSPVAGLYTGAVRPLDEARSAPSIQCEITRVPSADAAPRRAQWYR